MKSTLLIIFGSLLLTSCNQPARKAVAGDSLAKIPVHTIPGNFSVQTELVFDSIQIAAFFEKYPAVKNFEHSITSFYQKRNFSYAWFYKGKIIEQAGNLSNRLLNLDSEGVFKQFSYQYALDSLIHATDSKAHQKKPDITLELMLTSGYFFFSRLAWEGVSTSVSESSKWYLPRKAIAYESYLDSLLKTPSGMPVVDEPVYRQYELLKGYLRKYRKLADEEHWSPIAVAKKTLKPGDSSLIISQVKHRLLRLEDYKSTDLSIFFDDDLFIAVKHFQDRNGLTVNGLINKETIAELNVPPKTRIKQILVNMERSRWLPVSLEGDYLAVNIPEFKLHVYRADSLLWSCNAVVGKTVHPTTVFYGEIKYVVFSPYWNVPPGILKNEVLPGMRKDPAYLAKHHMEVTGYSNGLPVVRQKPGPSNALGLVKFLFPNSYNIYLHDTPSKSLFGETSRAFSHGCIRIEQPAKLADFLLSGTGDWHPDKISTAMHAGRERYVTLENKVPVFIAYFTAFVDRTGSLNFRKDIYNLDDRLASMLVSGENIY